MSYIQLAQPIPNVKGEVANCLKYGRMFYGAPAVEYTAWEAWQATKYKHLDRNLPNVSVPVWFKHWGTYYDARIKAMRTGEWGHEANWVPGVGFYSSPYKKGTDHALLKSIEEVEGLYQCKFVGWSEDISGVRVTKQGDNVIDNADDLDILWRFATDNGVNQNDIKAWVNTGKTWHDVLVYLAADGNRKNWLAKAKAPKAVDVEPYNGPQLYVKKG